MKQEDEIKRRGVRRGGEREKKEDRRVIPLFSLPHLAWCFCAGGSIDQINIERKTALE